MDISLRDIDTRRALNATATVLLLALVLPFVVYAVPQVVGASQSYVVLSSSMSPTIQAGDVVVVNDVSPSEISEGDVITFRSPGGDQSTGGTDKVTHRVIEVVHEDGERHFRTKGDANEEVDKQLVPPKNVIGRVGFAIPYIGHVITLVAGTTVQVALIVVPAILLVANELWTLTRAARSQPDRGDGDSSGGD